MESNESNEREKKPHCWSGLREKKKDQILAGFAAAVISHLHTLG